MQNIFSVSTKNGNWWEGTLSIRYNFLTIAKWMLTVLAVALALFSIYWLGIGIWAGLKLLWSGICWLAAGLWSGICWLAAGLWSILCWIASQWMWILGAALLAFIGWLLSKVKWQKSEHAETNEKRSWKWEWLWLLLLVLLLLCGLLWLPKSCDSSEPKLQSSEMITVSDEQFDEAFDWVVTTRAYLDGVQEGGTKAEVALVGLKFVNGQSVTKMTFQGRTYEESVAIVASDWRKLVADNVHIKLTDSQLIALTLFAMRNGKYGFLKSDFLRNINNGNMSSRAMALHAADGSKRVLGVEGLQYLWVLKNLWDGNISAKELIDYPMFSYKAINLGSMYDGNRDHLFNEKLRLQLSKGSFSTPRKALDI